MRHRASFSPSRKVDFKTSFMNASPSEQSSFANLAERSKFENVRSSSKFVSSKSSFLNKNSSDTSSLTNLNSLVNSNNFKSSLSNSSNFNSNSSLPQSPTVEEPFSPRLDALGDINRGEFNKKDSFKDGFKDGFKESFKNEFANSADGFQKANKNIFYNNSNNNIKHVSYSISSSGSKSNNKICQINNKISNRILNRNSSTSESNNSLLSTGTILDPIDLQFEALHMASKNANFENREPNESPNPIVANAYLKIGTKMTNLVEQYKDNLEPNVELKSAKHIEQEMNILTGMHYLLAKSQSIPYYGIELVNNLGKILCNLGALDHIVKNFVKPDFSQLGQQPGNVQRQTSNIAGIEEEDDELVNVDENNNKVTGGPLANNLSSNESLCERKEAGVLLSSSPAPALADQHRELKYASAKLLNNCLTKENAAHLIQNNYANVPDLVEFCCNLARNRQSTENEQVGTGILRNLLEYNEDTCKEILIKLNAIDTILFECRTADIQTLRNCVHCLANVVLFGGEECQQKLVDRSLLIWLFPLASHRDLQIKYFALMTMIILVANKEIEGAVLKTGSLELIEPFLLSNSPQEFATFRDNVINNNGFGQSKEWLKKLVAVLDCDREQAKNLCAFHFAMESFVKKKLGQQNIFREINAINSLKKAASSPFAVASRFAAMALKSLGELVPHKLSQQVALWTINDVKEWIKQIDFTDYLENFEKSKVDGDLLLRMNEGHLENDIRIKNSLLRMRFLRELKHLKKIAEYSNCDTLNIEKMLNSIGEDYVQYTYSIIQSGLDARTMPTCSLEQLREVCGISNDFHAENIINAFKNNISGEELKGPLESIDAFISYRRVGGSQLASLLKVHLSLKGIKVFLDVEKLQAGKFHHDLLTSIKSAKNFLLVLTPHSLDRCIEDKNCDDWIHKEIVEALKNKCNIIPITYEFEWPNIEKIPEDMRPICQFNAVSWVHEFQEASVNKILRFMQQEPNPRKISQISSPSPTPFSLHGSSQNK